MVAVAAAGATCSFFSFAFNWSADLFFSSSAAVVSFFLLALAPAFFFVSECAERESSCCRGLMCLVGVAAAAAAAVSFSLVLSPSVTPSADLVFFAEPFFFESE